MGRGPNLHKLLGDRPEWSNRLVEARVAKGLTQDRLARQIGVSQTMYSSFETGRSEPPFVVLCKLTDALGVSLDWLLLGPRSVPHASTAPVKEADIRVIRQAAQDILGVLDLKA
ncbi:helix-turn-helix domain-containing protein [Muricoccus radiodurans]|uniref:helix-turn-helix domain-containing protein n=1 Tax=Muricoccus radiodurans TaxID=2231721 RepID=UPI003CF5E856